MFYFKDDNQLTVYFADGTSAVWSADNPEFNRVLELCQKAEWPKVELLNNQAKAFMSMTINLKGDTLTLAKDGTTVVEVDIATSEDKLHSFIRLLKEKGIVDSEIEKIKPFLINMFENPYINAIGELYDYCRAMDFEITEDGCFIAYKNVRNDLGSIYDGGRTKHVIGEITKVDNFDTNRNNVCSAGLHFCSREYLKSYTGEVTLAMKINPRDVVAIPVDYNFQKGRCLRYEPIGVIGANSTLQTVNIEAMTDNKVKIIKTPEAVKRDAELAKKSEGRVTETKTLMDAYNDADKVAAIMHISKATVERNMRRYNAGER